MSAGIASGAHRSLVRIAAIADKELRHLRRDRLTGGMILGIPVMMTLLFGYAINQDVRGLRAGVADLAGTQESRWLIQSTEASQVIRITHRVTHARALEDLLRRGEISVGLVIPADFERRVARGARPAAQLLVDGADPLIFSAARGLTELPIPSRTEADPHEGTRPATGSTPGTGRASTFEFRPYYNPERRSPVYIVPGLCGAILNLTLVLFTAAAIVRERERGNLELLITTPVRRLELMLGKIAPYIGIGYLQVTLILTLGVVLFQVPIRGSLLDLAAGAGCFVAAALALGLLISTAARTQFQAFQMSFVSFLPQLLLSGFMFPFDGMPRPAQLLAEIFPLTHFLRVARGIVLRGADLGEVSADLWPLALFFALATTASAAAFRKRLD